MKFLGRIIAVVILIVALVGMITIYKATILTPSDFCKSSGYDYVEGYPKKLDDTKYVKCCRMTIAEDGRSFYEDCKVLEVSS